MTTPDATPPAAEWVALDGLAPWDRNARQHSDDSTTKLAAGIRRFGFLVPLTAWRSESRIAAGHGRRLAMQALLHEDPNFVPRNAPPGVGPGMVPVMFEDFASEAQFKAFAIADNRQAKNAEDDDEAIARLLHELDMEGMDFDGMGFGDDEVSTLLEDLASGDGEGAGDGDGSGDDLYTKKIKAPIYEPKMDHPPPLSDLIDSTKTAELQAQIDEADIPADVAAFLRRAADRHTSFHFRNIAEFYCHASPEVQDLMERSGLVIIDFDKAVEYGFVRMSKRLAELAGMEQDHAGA
jgi:hypothetical protein